MTTKAITELVQYGIQSSLITEEDRIYCTNQLLEMLGLSELTEEWEGVWRIQDITMVSMGEWMK